MEISYENNGIFVRKTMDSIGRMVSAEEADRLLRKYPGRYKVMVWYKKGFNMGEFASVGLK